MFGRRTTPPGPPASPAAGSEFPIEPMRDALLQAARQMSRALSRAGIDCAGLGETAKPTQAPAGAIAKAMRFHTSDGARYFAFGSTRDFNTVDFDPNFRVFLITNICGLIDDFDRIAFPDANAVVASMAPSALLDAQMMRAWLGFPLAVSAALADGREPVMRIGNQIRLEMQAVVERASPMLREQGQFVKRMETWSTYPMVASRAWTPENQGINGLPMSPEHQREITAWLAEQQAHGLSERGKAA